MAASLCGRYPPDPLASRPVKLRRVLLAMALGGAAWSAILIIGLLAGLRLLPTGLATPVAAVLVLPAFVVSVVVDRAKLRGLRLQPLIDNLPQWVPFVAGGSFVLFWVAGMTALSGLGGTPGTRGSQYILNNHGSLTVVDKATYEREIAREQRLALGVFGAFGVAGAVFSASAVNRPPSE